MQPFLTWVDQIAQTVRPWIESDKQLLITIDLEEAPDDHINQILARGPAQAELGRRTFVACESTGPSLSYNDGLSDLILDEPWWDATKATCLHHSMAYHDLWDQQREFGIPERRRLDLVREISCCPDCTLRFKLFVQIDKSKVLAGAMHGRRPIPPGVVVQLWLGENEFRRVNTLRRMLAWEVKSVILALRWDLALGCDFISCVRIDRADFVEQLLLSAERLVYVSEKLPRLKAQQTAIVPTQIVLAPAGYWVSEGAVESGRLNADLVEWFYGAELMALSIITHCATSVDYKKGQDAEILTFTIDRERRAFLEVTVGENGLMVSGEMLDLKRRQAALVDFYKSALYGSRPKGNQTLVQTAILMAADGEPRTLLTNPERIQVYYDFQYQTMFDERFKQQVEVSRLYVTQWHEARAKVGATISELYKNLATIATALGALAAAAVLKAIEGDKAANTLVLAGSLLGLLYVPAHLVWVDNVVDESIARLKDFLTQMGWSARMLKFPDVESKLTEDVRELVRLLMGRVSLVVLYLGGVFVLAYWLAARGYSMTDPNVVGKEPILSADWFHGLYWGSLAVLTVLGGWRLFSRARQVIRLTRMDGQPLGRWLGWFWIGKG